METQASTTSKKRNMPNRTIAGKEVWPDDLKRKLADLWARDMPIKQIAFELDKSVASVKAMRFLMKLPRRKAAVGSTKEERLRLHLSLEEMDSIRRKAQYHRRTVQSYVKMLLRRDGAL